MLGKLLKYDFKAVMKYWWIAALTSFLLSFVGGFGIIAVTSERKLPTIVMVVAVMGLVLVIISYVVFYILSLFFIYARFYKNFFTDEGYLTFTLPVKRSQLLNSKLIMSITTIFLTGIVCIIDVMILFTVALAEEIFQPEIWVELKRGFDILTQTVGIYLLVYIIEGLIIIVLSVLFSCLFLFCCITFASIISKKAKVLVAIGIYYGANWILSLFVQIFSMFGISSLNTWLTNLPDISKFGLVALLLLGFIAFFGIFCALLYTLQYWMLDRKLNLN